MRLWSGLVSFPLAAVYRLVEGPIFSPLGAAAISSARRSRAEEEREEQERRRTNPFREATLHYTTVKYTRLDGTQRQETLYGCTMQPYGAPRPVP